jgi:hypothetical protein
MLMAIYAKMPASTAAAPIAESIIDKMLIQASFRLVGKRVYFIPVEIYHNPFPNKTLWRYISE